MGKPTVSAFCIANYCEIALAQKPDKQNVHNTW